MANDDDAQASRLAKYLHPGDLFASAEPYTITTVLGSCVAVCLWDAKLGAGGMNHYMLPYDSPQKRASMRFGPGANSQLLARVLALGCRVGDLRAKVFGGASLTTTERPAGELGRRNARLAMDFLSENGIPVAAADTGGGRGRKIVFHLHDGTVWLKRLGR